MYTIQISIPTLNFFETETFTSANKMFVRYAELIADQPSGVEIECMVK